MNKLLLLAVVALLHFEVKAQTIAVTDSTGRQVVGRWMHFFEDSTKSMDLAQVMESEQAFFDTDQEVPNFQYTQSAYWGKISLLNTSSHSDLAFEINNAQLDRVTFYQWQNGQWSVTETGDLMAYDERKIDHQHFIFPIELAKGDTATYFFRFESEEQLSLPIRINNKQAVLTNNYRTDLFAGLYFGIMFVMLFYNLFVYYSVRDKSYLYYVLYIFGISLAQASLLGYTFKYFWPNAPYVNHLSVLIFSALAGFGAIQFARHFLQLKVSLPRIDLGIKAFSLLYFIAVGVFLVGFRQSSYYLLDFCALFLSLYALYFSIRLSLKGQRTAKFFLLAWSFFMIGMFIYVARNMGWLPYTFFTKNVLLMGSGLEAVLLSVALADRINVLKRENERAQAEALEKAMENEQLVKEQNVLLEAKVGERTAALEATNAELAHTLSDLKNAQTQLVNAEKMASLGQITAGIAHEINNPINFVTSNIIPLRRDLQDLFELINQFEQIEQNDANLDQLRIQIKQYKSEIDYNYLKEEVEILLAGMEDGAHRTAEIVKGLRTFSRLDESDLKYANINEGIDSTLVLLNSSLNHQIKVTKQYCEDAVIECYPGKINQVVMNLLNNAIQAIHANPEEAGHLSITTQSTDENLLIIISDTGIGMTPEVQAKIFEPFFTTKPVGKGTGLGLSIAYSIIESHQGQIEVASSVGKGTTFTIELPKKLNR